MAKLILLLVFVCFQFSSQEELIKTSDELVNPKFELPANEMLDGEDKDHWYKEEESDELWKDDLSEESDEDYDFDPDEVEKLIKEIENWIEKTHPEKQNYVWLLDLEKWLEDDYNDDDDDDYEEYPEISKKTIDMVVDDKNNMDLYYSWLYKTQVGSSKTKRAKPFKRFWSV